MCQDRSHYKSKALRDKLYRRHPFDRSYMQQASQNRKKKNKSFQKA